MKAVGFAKPLPVTDPECLLDVELPEPEARGHDLLVEVRSVSVNPADAKLRATGKPLPGETYRILGYDATGVVKAVGDDVTLFQPGDEVWYAGSITRQGTNSEFHLVDERIVGKKPKSLSFSHAAALPLTSITAWELLFDRLGVSLGKPTHAGSLLIIGGAGGVGSILIQLARRLTGLTVIATSSTPETKQWCLDLGAHFVVDHREAFPPQLKAIGLPEVEYIACLTATDQHYPGIVDVLAPEGAIGIIDDPASIDAKPLKLKAASLRWELMFTRPMFQTKDMIAQHKILNEISHLVDEGLLKTTFGVDMGRINAANLRQAHAVVEGGRSRGKAVLSGF
jgi:NADPH:quinone reductase